jgi:hypothetical protein
VMAEEASLQGWRPIVSEKLTLSKVVGLAFAYRGDVSFDLVDGSTIVGYLFNYSFGHSAEADELAVEVIRTDTGRRLRLRCDEIGAIRFTGRDMAAGQSLEAWQRRRRVNAEASEAHQ